MNRVGSFLTRIRAVVLRNSIARFLVAEALALFVSALLVIIIGIVFVELVGHIYNIRHPIPDPVIRGVDLGLGLVMVFAALGSLLISLPIAVLVHIYIFRNLFKRSLQNE